ncbi:hypothetical protein AwDysgo_05550 [Bacteroidales bacterium]|nr:hypothetical protein AwDysgo_05550 [Bacteroidales bacterium]
MNIKKHVQRSHLTVLFLFFASTLFSQYKLTSSFEPLLAENNSQQRMAVYMLRGLSGSQISFTSDDNSSHQWYRYKTRASDSEAVSSVQTGSQSVVSDLESGWAYYVGSPADMSTSYVWIIDYLDYLLRFNSLTIDDDLDDVCTILKLIPSIEASPIYYYSTVGTRLQVHRKFDLSYTSLVWNEESKFFEIDQVVETFSNMAAEILVKAPLINTTFSLKGDQFAHYFGLEETLETPQYTAIAVEAHVRVEKIKNGVPEISWDPEQSEDFGGSGPFDLSFSVSANEPVAAFYLWTISRPESSETLLSFSDPALRGFEFSSGKYEVKYEVGDRGLSCVDSLSFIVDLASSELKVPNAFTPHSSPGVNDEFKVSYRSISRFKASIFNRWGTLLYQWTDPSQGWDGSYKGKLVPTGVYFYVIDARGSDGRDQSKSGSINILK